MNVGQTDMYIRLVLGALLIAAGFMLMGGLTTSVGSVAIIVGCLLGATSIFSFCPVYKLLGISTVRSNH